MITVYLVNRCFAEENNKRGNLDSMLKYTVKSIKDTFYLDEPIIVNCILENISDVPIYLSPYGGGSVQLSSPNQPLGLKSGSSRGKLAKENFFLLPPGGTISGKIDLSSDIYTPNVYFYSRGKSWHHDGTEFGLKALTGYVLSNKDTFIVIKADNALQNISPFEKFSYFLEKLDESDIESINIAKYKIWDIVEFDKEHADSIFRIFYKFYRETIRECNNNFFKMKDYQFFLHEISELVGHTLENPIPTFKKIDNKKSRKLKNDYAQIVIDLEKYVNSGVIFYQSEGDWYLAENPDFLDELSNLFSGELKDYLIFLASEYKERLAEDAGLLISWNNLRQRIIRWEEFAKKHEKLKEIGTEIQPKLHTLFSVYLIGTDNTKAYDIFTGKLDTNLKLSYQNFIEENKDSNYYSIIDSVYKILGENKFEINSDLIKYLENTGYTHPNFIRWADKFLKE